MFHSSLQLLFCAKTHWWVFDYVCWHCSTLHVLVTLPFVFGSLYECDGVLCLSPCLRVRIMFVAYKCLLVFDLIQGIPVEPFECTPM